MDAQHAARLADELSGYTFTDQTRLPEPLDLTAVAVAAGVDDGDTLWCAVATDTSVSLRRLAAISDDLPRAAAEILTQDPIPGVRALVAQNPAVDDDLVATLARDTNSCVRAAAAANPRTRPDSEVR